MSPAIYLPLTDPTAIHRKTWEISYRRVTGGARHALVGGLYKQSLQSKSSDDICRNADHTRQRATQEKLHSLSIGWLHNHSHLIFAVWESKNGRDQKSFGLF